jgi:hypothetical protein
MRATAGKRWPPRLLPTMRLDPDVALFDAVDQLMRIEFAEIGGDFE